METARMEANSQMSKEGNVNNGGLPGINGANMGASNIKVAIVDSGTRAASSSNHISDVTPGNFMIEEDNDGKEGELKRNETMNGNNHIGKENEDTSDSSEAEMNELRNEIAAQTLLNRDVNSVMTTPGGGGADDVRMPCGSISSANINNGLPIGVPARVRLASDSGLEFGSIDISHIDSDFMNDDDNYNQLPKRENFSSQLSDKLVGIEMLENDIVKEMEFDKQEPNAVTPGGNQTAGADEYL